MTAAEIAILFEAIVIALATLTRDVNPCTLGDGLTIVGGMSSQGRDAAYALKELLEKVMD